jgi:hypothetical protein
MVTCDVTNHANAVSDQHTFASQFARFDCVKQSFVGITLIEHDSKSAPINRYDKANLGC